MPEYQSNSRNNAFKHALILFLCGSLILIDKNTSSLSQIRQIAEKPFSYLRLLPHEIQQTYAQLLTVLKEKRLLAKENESLKILNLQLKEQIQRTLLLERENNKLTELLGVTKEFDGKKLKVGKVITETLNTFEQTMLINLGSNDKIKVNQSVIDHSGLIGKIIKTSNNSSTVLLITSPNHGTPVMNLRNGERGILFSKQNELVLEFLPTNIDIQLGDTLITSGFGDVYPSGYPVAHISTIETDPLLPTTIKARPISQLTQNQYVLVLIN